MIISGTGNPKWNIGIAFNGKTQSGRIVIGGIHNGISDLTYLLEKIDVLSRPGVIQIIKVLRQT